MLRKQIYDYRLLLLEFIAAFKRRAKESQKTAISFLASWRRAAKEWL